MLALRPLAVLLLASTALIAAEANSRPVPLENQRCIDGQPVNIAIDPALVRLGDQTYIIRVSSRENAEAIRKMRPEAALRAVVAFNRELADRVNFPTP